MTISYIDSGWHISLEHRFCSEFSNVVRHGGKSFAAVMMLGLSGCPQHSLHQDGQGFLMDKDCFSRPKAMYCPRLDGGGMI